MFAAHLKHVRHTSALLAAGLLALTGDEFPDLGCTVGLVDRDDDPRPVWRGLPLERLLRRVGLRTRKLVAIRVPRLAVRRLNPDEVGLVVAVDRLGRCPIGLTVGVFGPKAPFGVSFHEEARIRLQRASVLESVVRLQ